MLVEDLDYIKAYKSDIITSNNEADAVIFQDAFMAAREYYGKLTPHHCQTMTRKQLHAKLNRYIKTKADFTNRPSRFIPSVIWWWIAKAIIKWIIRRIIDHIMKHDRE